MVPHILFNWTARNQIHFPQMKIRRREHVSFSQTHPVSLVLALPVLQHVLFDTVVHYFLHYIYLHNVMLCLNTTFFLLRIDWPKGELGCKTIIYITHVRSTVKTINRY